jgi:formylglycine-generating enzyme required for sulfatase activity
MKIDNNIFDTSTALTQYKQEVCSAYSGVRLLQFVEEDDSAKEIVDIEDVYVDLMCEPFSARRNGLLADGDPQKCSTTLVFPGATEGEHRNTKLNMVILGLPGSGKTTLLKYLLKKYSEQSKIIPIFIELKSEVETDFSLVLEKEGKVLASDLNDFIRNYFIARIGKSGEVLADEILTNQYSSQYDLVFFCDGLDEISPAQYKQFTAVVNKASSFRGYHFIISSRQIGFYATDYNERFKLYCLLDFYLCAQKEFIEKYFRKFSKGEPAVRKKQLLAVLDSQSDTVILRLAKSPILLSLLCVTPNLKTIKNKAQLFQNAIDVLLSNRKITNLEDRKLFVDFLKELAVIFFKLDKAECFDHTELEFYSERFFCSQGETASCTLLRRKYLSSGLFDKSEKANSFKFAHRTIWEYLVAEGMIGRDKSEIYSRANMGVWEEPIKMYVSIVGQKKSDALQVIEEIWNENKSLALNCMNEFEPFPIEILNNLYGGLSRRDKLGLIATLRNSYVNYNGSFRNPVINTIKETLTLIHRVEKDCEVIYAYLEFLSEFDQERTFASLLNEFLQLHKLAERQAMLSEYGLKFVDVFAGSFNMGRRDFDKGQLSPAERNQFIVVDAYEQPEHKVRITRPYRISKTLITNRMYFECGFPYADSDHISNPYSSAPDQPVNFVNWFEAMVFAKWFGYTLPSEAEWEYACRGGHGKNDFMTNRLDELGRLLDEKVNYTGDKTNRTRLIFPIDTKHGNSLGLIDMIGNLREWCIDWFSEDYYTKCIVDSYPSFQTDIEGRESVTYYWAVNGHEEEVPFLVDDKVDPMQTDVFTFDRNGFCLDPIKCSIGKIEAKSLRGGCFDWSIANLRPTYRNHNPANNVYKVNGFRVIIKEDF